MIQLQMFKSMLTLFLFKMLVNCYSAKNHVKVTEYYNEIYANLSQMFNYEDGFGSDFKCFLGDF